MTLFRITRDDRELLIEEAQVKQFLAEGWDLDPISDDAAAVDEAPLVENTELVSLTKGGDTRLYEINQVPWAKEQGWTEGVSHADEPKDHDERSRAPGRDSGPAEGRGPDLGRPGSGSGSGENSGSDDEPSEGREDLSKEIILAGLAKLDHDNDDHWTAVGNPSVMALRKILGWDVTGAQVREAAPELKRIETE